MNPNWPRFSCASCGVCVCTDCEGFYTADETSQLCLDCDDAATVYYGSDDDDVPVPAPVEGVAVAPEAIFIPEAQPEPPEATVVAVMLPFEHYKLRCPSFLCAGLVSMASTAYIMGLGRICPWFSVGLYLVSASISAPGPSNLGQMLRIGSI